VQLQKVPALTLIDRSGVIENNKNSYEISEVTIGRDPGNTISIDDTTVSNRHAVLNYRNGHWWIEDLLSTNGTFLNDEKITAPTILISGDDLHIGSQFYEVRLT
jgi:pSer/pThr/pTyr-binding forkhead associated (FHA) protein